MEQAKQKPASGERINLYTKYMVDTKQIFLEKNNEYGQSWLAYRPKSFVRRIWNKITRVRSIQEKGSQLVEDSIVSEFDAVYNFCLIALRIVERTTSDTLDLLAPIEIDMVDPIVEAYQAEQDKCFELFKKKDHDYSGAWVDMDISTIVDEILARMMRANQIIKNKNDIGIKKYKNLLFEIFRDTANYSAFASILIKELQANPMD